MKKVLCKLDHFIEIIQNYILILTGTAVTLMILINALFRFLAIDWFGSEELTLFVAFWLYFTGSACASREGSHISADMLGLFTKNQVFLRVIAILKNAVGLVMAAVFTLWTFEFVMWQNQLGAASAVYKLPVLISLIPILIAFALWTVYLLRDLLRCFVEKPEDIKKGAEPL